jgi:hypothetical protein
MRWGDWRWALVGASMLLGVTQPLMAQPSLANGGVPSMLAALERDIGAAVVHAATLRERLAAEAGAARLEPAEEATAADIAGIADGGSASSLAATRQVARALDRRLELLRQATADDPPKRTEIVLLMRMALGSVLWTLEDLPLATDEATGEAPSRRALLDRLDRALADLDTATDALAEVAW